MAELCTDMPVRFPHESEQQYSDRKTKFNLILEKFPDPDQAQSLSMVYSNIVYFHSRYPSAVEEKLAFLPEIAEIMATTRNDSTERVDGVLERAQSAYHGQK